YTAPSRLQSGAPPSTVLVGEATQRAAGSAIVFEAAADQVLKGKVSPVPAWRALRVVAQRGGVGRSETLEAPFVGRDEELRQLKEQFHATGREGRPLRRGAGWSPPSCRCSASTPAAALSSSSAPGGPSSSGSPHRTPWSWSSRT